MKLIHCKPCGDLFNLTHRYRQCACGVSAGYYQKDGINAVVIGDCWVLDICNVSYLLAVAKHHANPTQDMGYGFSAFIIPENAPTVKRIG